MARDASRPDALWRQRRTTCAWSSYTGWGARGASTMGSRIFSPEMPADQSGQREFAPSARAATSSLAMT